MEVLKLMWGHVIDFVRLSHPMFEAIEQFLEHNLYGKNLAELTHIVQNIEMDESFGVAKIIDEIFGFICRPKLSNLPL